MLLSSSSSGLGIPKSPSFHSSSELAAAAKDLNCPTIDTTEPMPSTVSNNSLNVQKQNILNKMKNNNPFLSNVGSNNGDGGNIINRNNPSLVSTSPVSGWGVLSSRARDRNVYVTPAASLAVSLPLLRGLHLLYIFRVYIFLFHFFELCQPVMCQFNLLYPHCYVLFPFDLYRKWPRRHRIGFLIADKFANWLKYLTNNKIIVPQPVGCDGIGVGLSLFYLFNKESDGWMDGIISRSKLLENFHENLNTISFMRGMMFKCRTVIWEGLGI